jgi:hypothetical protein
MEALFTRRLLWLFWLLAFAAFADVAVYPLSDGLTRAGGVVLLLVVWSGLIGLLWRQRLLRFALIGISISAGVFLALPLRRHVDAATLRIDDATALRRYEGVTYSWGGESFKGIDCSGLVRRGVVDASFCRGVRSFDPALVRYSLWLWWHDCTARDLGDGYRRMTVRVLETPSINALDDSRILPGDLAVSGDGVHVISYLGDHIWIEADPTEGRVISLSTPSADNFWFKTPMKIMRWSILGDQPGA